MARASRATRGARGAKKSTGVRVDLSNIGKSFEAGQEYAVRVVEASLEEGQKAPYFNLKLSGLVGGDYENAVMYHRASTGEASLWRLRPLLEAFGFEIPDGPLDLEAEDFIDREAMCSTYLDRYDGGSSIKPDEFWALDGADKDGDEASGDFDLDDLSDEEVEALAEAVGARGKNAAAMRKSMSKMDMDELEEAFKGLDTGGSDEEADEDGLDLDDLSDDDLMNLAKAMGLKGTTARRARTALDKEDPDDVAEAWAELSSPKKDAKSDKKGKKKGAPDPVSEDDIQDMNEDDLEKVVEDFDLDLTLSDFKTLRKMKNAVIDAMEEGDHFS